MTFEQIQEEMRKMSDPAYLHTISMNELYENVYQSRPPVIDGLLYSGTYLFAGAPKVGKSFFMAQLAYHVSTGKKLWDYEVRQGTVLYLALEDDYQRLQDRMSRMFGVEGTDHLHFAVYAKQLGAGLDEQLKKFLREHKDTKLIIIDTLQKIREVSTDAYSYANDYEIVGKMKQFADQEKGGKGKSYPSLCTKEIPKQQTRQGLLFLVLRDRMKATNLNLARYSNE